MYTHSHTAYLVEAGDPSEAEGLLDSIVNFLRDYVVVEEHEYVAIALWIIHTHAIEAADTTPYLAALGPDKRCGKTRLLETLTLLVREPRLTTNMSEAALFRMVASEQPTLLLDETDTIFGYRAKGEYESLRGLINSGYRRGAFVYRCVGDASNTQVQPFPTFCPKALAGIGDLPDTILDRSLVIAMRRSQPGEKVLRLRMNRPPLEAANLKTKIEAWVHEHLEALKGAEPMLPEALNDRAQDVCEPLIAIADLLGHETGERARAALIAIGQSQAAGSDESPGVLLLADIQLAFDNPPVHQLSTEELIERLCRDLEAPWNQWGHNGPIAPRGLARLLKPYRISSMSLGDGHHRGKKGYRRGQFIDAWKRYLPGSRDIGDNRDNEMSSKPASTHPNEDTEAEEDGEVSPMSRTSRNGDATKVRWFKCAICNATYDPADPGAKSLRCSSCAQRSQRSGNS